MPLNRSAVPERLARADPGVVVVTPTRRLARSIGKDFDAWQAARGQRVWETPRVLPFTSFVASCHDSAQHDPALGGVRPPLSQSQELALWEAVINASDVPLASPGGAAQMASEAWTLAHRWRIADRLRHYASSPDTEAFARWAADYERRVERLGAIDQARLPDAVCALVASGDLAVPSNLLLAGFAELTPEQEGLFGALAARGSVIEKVEDEVRRGDCRRIEAGDARDELQKMADWVADRLSSNPSARIAVVVPDLRARRRAIERALDAALAPDALLARPDRPRPYTLSLGGALADTPVVATALGALRLAAGPVDSLEASELLRSPHLDFGPLPARARFDAEWRRRAGRTATLEHLLGVSQTVRDSEPTSIRATLERLQAWRQSVGARRRRCSEWAALLGDGLRAAGFPGADPANSFEFQAISRWRELIADFASLDRVLGPLDLRSAVARVARLAEADVFQPEGGDPPVQVLGVLEAAGLHFDHLWLAGMSAEGWPVPVRAHPFLPLELQRARRMPGALVEAELERARRQLDALACSAVEVVASHATRDGDRALAPSPLIAHWAASYPPRPARRALEAMPSAALERLNDAQAPALLPGREAVGGTSVLTDVAACAFRAFAKHRLGADEPPPPHDGLDASERGELVHRVLARFWLSVPQRTRAFVLSMPPEDRRVSLERAAEQALARVREARLDSVGEQLLRVEKQRLVKQVADWLEYELRERAEFEVEAVEDRRSLAIGPLSLKGRLDRVDRLADGRKVVIDYKTGGGKGVGAWSVPRPDEPQLPLYLVASEPDARGVAFARVRAGTTEFVGLAEDQSLFPGARVDWRDDHPAWSDLVETWQRELTRLANEFALGRATVDPKRPDTCRYCGVELLCRLNERLGDAAEVIVDGDSGGDDE